MTAGQEAGQALGRDGHQGGPDALLLLGDLPGGHGLWKAELEGVPGTGPLTRAQSLGLSWWGEGQAGGRPEGGAVTRSVEVTHVG